MQAAAPDDQSASHQHDGRGFRYWRWSRTIGSREGVAAVCRLRSEFECPRRGIEPGFMEDAVAGQYQKVGALHGHANAQEVERHAGDALKPYERSGREGARSAKGEILDFSVGVSQSREVLRRR